MQHLQHLVEVGLDLRPQAGDGGIEVVAQVAVVVDGIDQGDADAEVALAEVAQVQLPQQVVAQGFRAGGALAHAIVVVVAGGGADPFLPGFAFAVPVFVDALVGVLAFVRNGLVRAVGIADFVRVGGTGLAVLGPVEQGIARHRLGDFGFEFDGGQLQQADRLAQLRRQDQMLVQPGGKARLHPD